jgi:hypothetical protein
MSKRWASNSIPYLNISECRFPLSFVINTELPVQPNPHPHPNPNAHPNPNPYLNISECWLPPSICDQYGAPRTAYKTISTKGV